MYNNQRQKKLISHDHITRDKHNFLVLGNITADEQHADSILTFSSMKHHGEEKIYKILMMAYIVKI